MSNNLVKDIAAVLNRHNDEARSDTPDYVLADFLVGSLAMFHYSVRDRDRHRKPTTTTDAVLKAQLVAWAPRDTAEREAVKALCQHCYWQGRTDGQYGQMDYGVVEAVVPHPTPPRASVAAQDDDEGRPYRCGAFNAANGEQCVLESDHAWAHIMPSDLVAHPEMPADASEAQPVAWALYRKSVLMQLTDREPPSDKRKAFRVVPLYAHHAPVAPGERDAKPVDTDALTELADWCQKMIDASPCCDSCDSQWRRRHRALLASIAALAHLPRVVAVKRWDVIDEHNRSVYGKFRSREMAQFYADGNDAVRVVQMAYVDVTTKRPPAATENSDDKA